MKVPRDRYDQDRAGMPVFAAAEKFVVLITEENMKDAIPQDDEFCAVALGCKQQLNTPYVSVGRSRTDLAMPHPEGVEKPGRGNTLWAVIRFINSKEAREVVIAADTEGVEERGGVVLTLLPPNRSYSPDGVKKRNGHRKKKTSEERKQPTEQTNELTLLGVRSLTGQRQRT